MRLGRYESETRFTMSAQASPSETVTQAGRPFQIDTVLGPNALLIRAFHGHEAVSELFAVDLELASEDFNIPAARLVSQPATVRILCNKADERCINGYINRFTLVPSPDRLARYRARLVPALWFLTRTTNCAIFQNKTTPEIVESIFRSYGITNYKMQLRGKYTAREYCVQYRETAFDFIARLMEEEGICYFFEHTDKIHTVILVDNPSAHKTCALHPQVSFQPATVRGLDDEHDYIQDWVRTVGVHPSKWTQADFQFKQPRLHLIGSVPCLSEVKGPELERYDYPGRFDTMGDAEQLTRIRMEEVEAGIDTITGRSNCRGLVVGSTFKVKDNFRSDQAGTFLLTAIDYEAEQGNLYAEDQRGGQAYSNRFEAIPAQTSYRPPQITPRPFVYGPQTAFVTGPAGEEIYVDEYGRVKVQFHWDRQGKYDDASSCWVRVSQSIAGLGWGAMQLPRVGHEVIVEFLEGDPDRPVITGRLYNAQHVTPYKLPAEKSKTTLKTLSYPGGGGFNEFRLEDKKGSEQIFLHGEKDLDVRIKNDSREWIGQDRHLIVKRDKLEQVGRDKHETIQRDQIEQIARDHHLNINGKQAVSIAGSQSLAVRGDVNEQFSGNQSTQVTGSCYIKGMNVVIEATTGLTINVGSSFLTINPMGIQMQGTMVQINSGGSALSGTAGNLVSPIAPTSPAEADDAKEGDKAQYSGGGDTSSKEMNLVSGSSSPGPSRNTDAPWHDPNSPENKDKKSWIEIELLDDEEKPVPGEHYRITLPDGATLAEGTLDERGRARVACIDPGQCTIVFPKIDRTALERK
jgi:type VI secretion system secreted protein VgrG